MVLAIKKLALSKKVCLQQKKLDTKKESRNFYKKKNKKGDSYRDLTQVNSSKKLARSENVNDYGANKLIEFRF